MRSSKTASLLISVHILGGGNDFFFTEIGHTRIRIQGKNFEIKYIVDVPWSIYLYLVLRRSALMKDQ